MIETLKGIITEALARLVEQGRNTLPLILAALAILSSAFLLARLARWLVARGFKGIEADRWLRKSGVSALIDRSGTLRTSRLLAQSAYWTVLLVGSLTALNVFGNEITTRIAASIAVLLPRLVAAALIVLAGTWIGQYSGRSALVWAVNQDLPFPRGIACVIRSLVVFAALAIAADTVGFARTVFLSAFLLVVGGLVLAAALAIGLGMSAAIREVIAGRAGSRVTAAGEGSPARSAWNHL